MKTLAFECSAGAASCCVFDDERLLGNIFSNVPLTHSQTLMPMAENLLSALRLRFSDIDRLAVANGPGSFTGVRIGIAAVKGLAAARNIPCVPVSTLAAMAHLIPYDGIVCAVMDARCNQVYNALFSVKDGVYTRLCPDRALMADELMAEIEARGERVTLVGDGAEMFKGKYASPLLYLPPEHLRFQNAVGVALAAVGEESVKYDELLPFYLRLPQAERELKKRKEEIK